MKKIIICSLTTLLIMSFFIFSILILSCYATSNPKKYTTSFLNLINDMETCNIITRDESNALRPFTLEKKTYAEWINIFEDLKERADDKDKKEIERMISFLKKNKNCNTNTTFTALDICTMAHKNKAITDAEFKEDMLQIKQDKDESSSLNKEVDYDALIKIFTDCREQTKIQKEKDMLTKAINYTVGRKNATYSTAFCEDKKTALATCPFCDADLCIDVTTAQFNCNKCGHQMETETAIAIFSVHQERLKDEKTILGATCKECNRKFQFSQAQAYDLYYKKLNHITCPYCNATIDSYEELERANKRYLYDEQQKTQVQQQTQEQQPLGVGRFLQELILKSASAPRNTINNAPKIQSRRNCHSQCNNIGDMVRCNTVCD